MYVTKFSEIFSISSIISYNILQKNKSKHLKFVLKTICFHNKFWKNFCQRFLKETLCSLDRELCSASKREHRLCLYDHENSLTDNPFFFSLFNMWRLPGSQLPLLVESRSPTDTVQELSHFGINASFILSFTFFQSAKFGFCLNLGEKVQMRWKSSFYSQMFSLFTNVFSSQCFKFSFPVFSLCLRFK